MAELVEVFSQAMKLPLEQRANLAHRLLVSLEQERQVDSQSLEATLVARQARVQSDEYTVFSASDTLDRMKQSLDRNKQ